MTLTQWQGTEVAVAQIDSVTIGGTPAEDDVYNILIGDFIVCTFTALAAPTVTTVRDGLRAAWDLASGTAKANPYSRLLTSADKSTDALTLTTAEKGWPFTITVSKAGDGTITLATDTVPLGPNFVDHAVNWSNGLPDDDYDVVVANNAVDMCWGLEYLSTITCTTLKIKKSYTGRIGLRRDVFAITANGRTSNANAMEYRPLYWKIGSDELEIGEGFGLGSDRIKLWQSEGSPTGDTVIKGTAASSIDVGLPAIRLRGNAVDLHVDAAIGGVGLGIEEPEYNSTTEEDYAFVNAYISSPSLQTTVKCGKNVTFTIWTQYGGDNSIRAQDGTSIQVVGWGGVITFIDGDYVVTQVDCKGANFIDNHAITRVVKTTTLTVGGTGEIGDIFEVYITVPQYTEDNLFGSSEIVKYAALLAKITSTSTSSTTTATQIKDAIQAVIDGGALPTLSVSSNANVVTVVGNAVGAEDGFNEHTLTTRTTDGGGTDDQTLVVGLPNPKLKRYSTEKINMYEGSTYDASLFANKQHIEHIEFFGGGEFKFNDTTHLERISGRRGLVGV